MFIYCSNNLYCRHYAGQQQAEGQLVQRKQGGGSKGTQSQGVSSGAATYLRDELLFLPCVTVVSLVRMKHIVLSDQRVRDSINHEIP